MKFENLNYFWLCLLIIPIVVVFARCVLLFNKFTYSNAYSNIPSWKRRYLSYFLQVLSLLVLILGLTDPYILHKTKQKEYKDIRLIFVVDVSRSMVYAEDILPNRLASTKKEIKKFYDSLDGLYECSILPFAGDANPYFCPLTNSRSSFMSMLDELDWRSAPMLGTDLTKALEAIDNIYVQKDKIDKSGINIILWLSDGGKEEAMATDRIGLLKLARELSAKNFVIHTIGVGSEKAAPLILRDSNGNFVKYIKYNDQIAYSQMDEEILKQVAQNGKGSYHTSLQDMNDVIKRYNTVFTESYKVDKLYLQSYLFLASMCSLLFCLFLNEV